MIRVSRSSDPMNPVFLGRFGSGPLDAGQHCRVRRMREIPSRQAVPALLEELRRLTRSLLVSRSVATTDRRDREDVVQSAAIRAGSPPALPPCGHRAT